MSCIEESAAYKRGIARAAAELAKVPADDGTATVSVAGASGRVYFRLCTLCGWTRESRRCAHGSES